MKKIYMFAAAAVLFAACTSDDVAVKEKPQAQLEQDAVSFDAYTQRSVTRAGNTGDLTTDNMKGSYGNVGPGFGVFGYYTNNNDYDQLALPNFMWNQQVYAQFATSSPNAFENWTYTPVKYWPNEYGANAISDDNDKVTFFAYAPWVDVSTDGKVNPGTGDVKDDTWGITGMTRNTNAGDPIIKYIGSFKAANAVDLCWGVCQQNDWQIVQTGGTQTFELGKPWLNVQRPGGVTQKLNFQFRHALAKMNIDINAFVDGYDKTNTLNADETRIWIRSVRFTGFTMKGALNLNNENPNEPYWMNYNGIGDLVADDDITVYDQRKDGKEGVSGATATNEKVGGLNTNFIQKEELITSGVWKSSPTGVTGGDAKPLFEGGGIFYVIPTGDPVEVEIVYDVETISPNLATTISDGTTPGSSIENRISKKILFGDTENKLEFGKAYSIHLHLGMNSVKFDAEVVGWDDMAAPDIDLPANMPAYTATTTNGNLSIPGADTEFVFAITGLKGGEAIPTIATNVPGVDKDANVYVHSSGAFKNNVSDCDKRANASGVVYVKVDNVTPNTTIKDLSAKTISLTGALTAITTINVIQKAEALGLYEPTGLRLRRKVLRNLSTPEEWTVDNTNCPTLAGYNASSSTNNYIRVWRNGAELTLDSGSGFTANEFQFANDTGIITLGSAAVLGDVFKVTIKAGDVPEETISFTYNP